MDNISPQDFQYILFERINPEKNEERFYYLSWMPTLFHRKGAVVRMYGRKGESQHVVAPIPFASVEDAWPPIRRMIRTRLQRGYHIVEPRSYRPPDALA